MRWKAERWMKVRHMPAAFRARSVVRAAQRPPDARAHVPGQHVASVVGLESARDVFRRYRAIRERERTTWTGRTRVRPGAAECG